MNQTTLQLPWPPSLNTYWRSPNKGPLAGRTLISEKGRKYRDQVEFWATHFGCNGTLYRARLSVAIFAHPPDKRRRDLDNLPKAVLDALTHAGVWADDEQIDHLSIQRCDRIEGGRIRVVITKIEQCATTRAPA